MKISHSNKNAIVQIGCITARTLTVGGGVVLDLEGGGGLGQRGDVPPQS